MTNHPGRAIKECDVEKLFCEAYNRAATVTNAVSGFRTCDIQSYNPNVFSDFDFASTKVTERPLENCKTI